jgi:osmotically-inducible protein OsmY
MRTVIRALLIVVLFVTVGFFAFGWWSGRAISRGADRATETPTATTGTVDTSAARERGAELGEKAATAAAKAEATVDDARITAKIKAKMALDDYVRARRIDVTTDGSTVTLTGRVGSSEEHDRALRIARETVGVTRVIDRLEIRR